MVQQLEKMFIVFALLFFAGAFMNLSRDKTSNSEDVQSTTNPVLQRQQKTNSADPTANNNAKLGLEIFVYLVTAILIFRDRHRFLTFGLRNKMLWGLIALAFTSVLWSALPLFCLRRSMVLLASTCFGVYLAVRYSTREVFKLVLWTLAISAVFSIIFAIVFPQFGIEIGAAEGAWRGIFTTKNGLGRLMSFGAIIFVVWAIGTKRFRWLYWCGALVCSVVAVMSRDATAVVTIPTLLILLAVFHLLRRRSVFAVATLLAAASVIIVAFLLVIVIDLPPVLKAFGKDATLTGRTQLWVAVWEKFLQHPWLGYGYSSFWVGLKSQQSADIWSVLHWPVPHSHNGFLDLLVEVGIVGLVLFLVGFVSFFRDALTWTRVRKDIFGLWPLMFLAFTVVSNFSESSILKQESFFWVLYAAFWVLAGSVHYGQTETRPRRLGFASVTTSAVMSRSTLS